MTNNDRAERVKITENLLTSYVNDPLMLKLNLAAWLGNVPSGKSLTRLYPSTADSRGSDIKSRQIILHHTRCLALLPRSVRQVKSQREKVKTTVNNIGLLSQHSPVARAARRAPYRMHIVCLTLFDSHSERIK